jgi:hypothetical protein
MTAGKANKPNVNTEAKKRSTNTISSAKIPYTLAARMNITTSIDVRGNSSPLVAEKGKNANTIPIKTAGTSRKV